MPDRYPVRPDRDFLHRVLEGGGGDLKKCFQCATCSMVCELSNGRKLFPRKEMIWAQWGLKDRLVADPDIWLCHQCNDCSTKCPRGARPGDVVAALRHESVKHYAVPGFLATWANQIKFIPVLLAIPAVLLVLALLVKEPLLGIGPLASILNFMHHEGFYADLYPHWLLIGFYTFFWGVAMLGLFVGVIRFWKAMKAADEASGGFNATLGLVPSTIRALTPLVKHDKFGQCSGQASRKTAHLGAFYGFVALFLVSVWAVVALYMINPLIPGHESDLHYPFGLLNPWKILANLGAVALIAGCAIAIINRRSGSEEAGASTSFDWIFVWLLLLVGVTGLLTELIRLVAEPAGVAALKYTAYAIYFVHLVLVFDLLVYLPYSKFAHIVYRTVALVYAEYTGRSDGKAEAT